MTAILNAIGRVPMGNSFIFALMSLASLLALLAYLTMSGEKRVPGFPMASVPGRGPKVSWFFHGRRLLAEATEKYTGPFQIMTGTGPLVILPNQYLDEIRAHPHMSLIKAVSKDFFIDYSGYEPFQHAHDDNKLVITLVRSKLMQALDVIVDDMVDESASSLHDVYGNADVWETVHIKDAVLDLVTRISSRVFLGRNLCRNKRWLHIAKNYTVQIFIATQLIQMLPGATRPFLRWIIPQYRASVRSVQDARKLINPEVDRLDLTNQAAEEKKKEYTAITWLRELGKGREIDVPAAQLLLSLNSIHTTGEVLTQAMIDVCEFPGVVEPLRQEIIRVIGQHGWSRRSLRDLELMDSFLRESQRHHPIGIASLLRSVEKDVTLSDGTLLPAGTRIKVMGNCRDLDTFAADPDEFKPWRFFEMRQDPGQQNAWQLAIPGKTHLIFGHGKHACPGRFFATLELKIALCHLLLKYDWRFLPGTSRPAPLTFGDAITVSDKARFQCRRRQEEVSLEVN